MTLQVVDTQAVSWLATIENADRALAEAVQSADLPRIVAIRDQAAALAHLAEQQRYAEQWQRQAAGIKLRSERAAGEILASIEREAGKRTDLQPGTSVVQGSEEWEPESQIAPEAPQSPYQQALNEIGIPKSTAKRWQAEATLSEPAFERFLAETPEPTQAALLRAARVSTAPPKPAVQPPLVNHVDVQGVLTLLDSPLDAEGVAEVRRVLILLAQKARVLK